MFVREKVCVCVCVYVCERESVCVCVCVCLPSLVYRHMQPVFSSQSPPNIGSNQSQPDLHSVKQPDRQSTLLPSLQIPSRTSATPLSLAPFPLPPSPAQGYSRSPSHPPQHRGDLRLGEGGRDGGSLAHAQLPLPNTRPWRSLARGQEQVAH